MTNKTALWAIILLAASCQDAIKNTERTGKEMPENKGPEAYVISEPRLVTPSTVVHGREDLFGYWVGDFEQDLPEDKKKYMDGWDYANKINISIDSLNGDSVIGHSVVAGNRRPFRGSVLLTDSVFRFKVREPGDDKYDGVFEFSIALHDSVLKGKWLAYGEIEIPSRKFELGKRFFRYRPEAELDDVYVDWEKFKKKKIQFVYEDGEEEITEDYMETYFLSTTGALFDINSSTTLLDKKTVENLSKADIFILRNAIYAKHGYAFKKRPLRAYFDNHTWYMPVYSDIRKLLTETEKKNIQLLLSYEKHAEAYYDVFGR